MSDAWINPVTGAYDLTQGTPVRDPAGGLANAVYLRLTTPLGSYWADPALGSRLHELQREKDLARVAILARQYAEQALAPIVEDGRATAVEVATQRAKSPDGSGRLNLLIEVTAASGERFTFLYPVKVI
jgi:phage gp46-like protein